MDLRHPRGSRLQPHKRPLANRPSPPASAVRLPILVPAAQPRNHLVSSELLLPMQQRGVDHEGDLETDQIILHFPICARERQILALQEYPALLPVIVYVLVIVIDEGGGMDNN